MYFLQSNKLTLLANILLLCLLVDARGFTEHSRRSFPLLGSLFHIQLRSNCQEMFMKSSTIHFCEKMKIEKNRKIDLSNTYASP